MTIADTSSRRYGAAPFATSRGDSEIDSQMPPRELQDVRKMREMYFDCFEKEAEKLLADLQSNGDIQISGPEESILKPRRKSSRHAITIISIWLLDPIFRTS